MFFSGIAWSTAGFSVSVVDASGRQVTRPFESDGRSAAAAITEYLGDLEAAHGEKVVAVIDSTNGILDGSLMAAGLTVYRADPWNAPILRDLESPDALTLAETARRDLARLTKLEIASGTLTGRLEEVDAKIAEASTVEGILRRKGRCISHGSRDDKRVALTFDDGPHPVFTPQVLEVLDRYGVTATFFCVGLYVNAHPEIAARTSAAGHMLANHTWSHPFLPDLSKEQLSAQICSTADRLTHLENAAPAIVRPPYGSRSSTVLSWLEQEEATLALWDVEPFDWALPGPDVIARRVIGDVRAGSIILLHDGGGDRSQTVAALPRIIEQLRDLGHEFVTIDQFLPA